MRKTRRIENTCEGGAKMKINRLIASFSGHAPSVFLWEQSAEQQHIHSGSVFNFYPIKCHYLSSVSAMQQHLQRQNAAQQSARSNASPQANNILTQQSIAAATALYQVKFIYFECSVSFSSISRKVCKNSQISNQCHAHFS